MNCIFYYEVIFRFILLGKACLHKQVNKRF
jgi:hypothetical protein